MSSKWLLILVVFCSLKTFASESKNLVTEGTATCSVDLSPGPSELPPPPPCCRWNIAYKVTYDDIQPWYWYDVPYSTTCFPLIENPGN